MPETTSFPFCYIFLTYKMPAPIIDVILQEEIKKTTRDDPTVTLVSCDGEEILVHRQKMKRLIYFDKKITDKLRKSPE